MIAGRKDSQSVDRFWEPVGQEPIGGVEVREVRHVVKDDGHLTEVYRRDWDIGADVDQVFQVVLQVGMVSAWHTHRLTVDRLFVASGTVKLVLFDDRDGSPTAGRLNVFRLGDLRPALVLVPPGVWHGLQNIGAAPAAVLNLVDRAYEYEDPDHWRVPPDSPEIPYQWD